MLYPMKFYPIYKDKIWGGQGLKTHLGRDIDPSSKVGESWEISDHEEDTSVVSNGELKGKSLCWVLQNFCEELMGKTGYERFPLLFKYIDANDRLSVQVHPDDKYADGYKKGELGKTEMWYVIHAKPGAELIVGLRDGARKNDFEKAIKDNTTEKYLYRMKVKTGDAVFLPSGRIHAIMEGLLIAEVEQNSDLTFRLYDWGRVGFDKKPRPVHIKESLDVINFSDYAPSSVEKKWAGKGKNRFSELARCEYFIVEEYEVKEVEQMDTAGGFKVINLIDGSCDIVCGKGKLRCEKGESVLVPAVCGAFKLVPSPACRFLMSYEGNT